MTEIDTTPMPGWWIVLTPEYTYTIPVMDDGSGPRDITCDYLLVEAPTKRKAISRAVAHWLRNPALGEWCRDQRSSRENPYSGITAELAQADAVKHRDDLCSRQWTLAATTTARAESAEGLDLRREDGS